MAPRGSLSKKAPEQVSRASVGDVKPSTADAFKKRTKLVDKYVDFTQSQPNFRSVGKAEADKFENLENKIKMEKIKKIRLLRGDIISAKQSRPPGLDDEEIRRRLENCMSIYSYAKVSKRNNHRPFSTIYNQYIKKDQRAEQQLEIHRIKSAFLKSGMACPTSQLQEALTKPQGLNIERPHSSIPTYAIGAFVNPFQIEKKKKAKKKPKDSSVTRPPKK